MGLLLRIVAQKLRNLRMRRLAWSLHGIFLPEGAVMQDPRHVRRAANHRADRTDVPIRTQGDAAARQTALAKAGNDAGAS